jgi:hypothetical protein
MTPIPAAVSSLGRRRGDRDGGPDGGRDAGLDGAGDPGDGGSTSGCPANPGGGTDVPTGDGSAPS